MEKRCALLRLRPEVELLYRPRQAPRPVLVVDDRRNVDTIAPAEQILERDDDELRAGTEEGPEQGVARAGTEWGVGIAARLPETRNRGAEVTLLDARVVPPFRQRLGIVSPGDRDRLCGIVGRVAERLARTVPLALPSQHFQARDVEPHQ